MSHLDPSALAQYNSLVDPHLQSYFSNERVQSHLKHVGLISGRGEIVPDSEYRTRLVRREHQKHVQHMLAENIVNRAIDMERARQAEMKRQFQTVAKAALVNNIKESRRRSGTFSGLMSHSADMGLLSIDTSWAQTRPKSVNQQNEISNELTHIPRVKSANIDGNYHEKSPSKTRNRRRRSLRRSKTRSSSPQRIHSSSKYSDSSSSHPCHITMHYYGPKIQVDYDHLVFEPIDEIIVMQQHCGGENIIVYKENLKAGAEFTFNSHRHSDYPFGLTLYVKGFIDSRISTCCEYKHRHGIRLGGKQGHFAIISVKGSKPCIKCRFEKQARLKKMGKSRKDKNGENEKSIIIPLPVSDEPKTKQSPVEIPVPNEPKTKKKPVEIPVRHASISNEQYSEDFDGSDKQKHSIRDGNSTDSSAKRSHTSERKSKSKSKDLKSKVPKRASPIVRKELTRKSSLTSDESSKEKTTKKTWQIIFHTSNIPIGKTFSVKFSFLANDQDDETETSEVNIKQFDQTSKSERQYSFFIKLKNIGKPEQIRFKMFNKENDDDEEEDIKWYLDHIELIDPESQSHSIFTCKQWIHPSQEKLLRISQELSRDERKRKTSSSTNSSGPSSPNYKIHQQFQQKAKTSARSSSSSDVSKQPPTKSKPFHRISPDHQSDQSEKSTPRNNQENKTRYRVTIYPSKDDDGEFNPNRHSRIFLRLNNQTKETNLKRKPDELCPTFQSGEKQTFQIDLLQNNKQKPTKLTIGYINSDITATKWKIDKIILVNLETGDETIFICKQIIQRDETNFRAEKTFQIQSNQSDDDQSTPTNQKINSSQFDHQEQIQTVKKQQTNEINKQKPSSSRQMTDDEEDIQTPTKQQTNGNNKQKPSSSRQMTDDEEEIQTSKKVPSSRKMSDDEQQIETRKKQTKTENNKQRPSSSQSVNKDEEQIQTNKNLQTNGNNNQKSPSFQSMNDDQAHYTKIFDQLDSEDELKLGSPRSRATPRPKTRRGRQNQNEEEHTTQPVDPLVGLDDLTNQTARSNDQQNQNSLQSTTTDHAENRFKRWYVNNDNDDDDDN